MTDEALLCLNMYEIWERFSRFPLSPILQSALFPFSTPFNSITYLLYIPLPSIPVLDAFVFIFQYLFPPSFISTLFIPPNLPPVLCFPASLFLLFCKFSKKNKQPPVQIIAMQVMVEIKTQLFLLYLPDAIESPLLKSVSLHRHLFLAIAVYFTQQLYLFWGQMFLCPDQRLLSRKL